MINVYRSNAVIDLSARNNCVSDSLMNLMRVLHGFLNRDLGIFL